MDKPRGQPKLKMIKTTEDSKAKWKQEFIEALKERPVGWHIEIGKRVDFIKSNPPHS